MTDFSLQEEADTELLALESIYEDKLKLEDDNDQKRIKITIYPATGENTSSQYVCLEISFTLPKSYPALPPEIIFSMSRGLSDSSLEELKNKMTGLVADREGECILFDLMEMAKDILTSNNIPNCLCSICLLSFQEGDDFLKTNCYHYFHCHCIWEYYNHSKSLEKDNTSSQKEQKNIESVPCPICRLLVTVDINALERAKPPLNNTIPEPDPRFIRQHHLKYEKHYQKQLKSGGLINLEYEQNKFLLSNIQQTYETQLAAAAAVSAELNDPIDAQKPLQNKESGSKKYNSNTPSHSEKKFTERPKSGRPHYFNNKTNRNRRPHWKINKNQVRPTGETADTKPTETRNETGVRNYESDNYRPRNRQNPQHKGNDKSYEVQHASSSGFKHGNKIKDEQISKCIGNNSHEAKSSKNDSNPGHNSTGVKLAKIPDRQFYTSTNRGQYHGNNYRGNNTGHRGHYRPHRSHEKTGSNKNETSTRLSVGNPVEGQKNNSNPKQVRSTEPATQKYSNHTWHHKKNSEPANKHGVHQPSNLGVNA